MTAEDIRVFVEPAIARFNDRDDRLGFLESYAPDVRLHGYPAGMDGHEGLKRFHASLWDAFPDAELGVEDTVVEGDRAALRYRLTGTHRGRYLGVAPTGRAIDTPLPRIRCRSTGPQDRPHLTDGWSEMQSKTWKVSP